MERWWSLAPYLIDKFIVPRLQLYHSGRAVVVTCKGLFKEVHPFHNTTLHNSQMIWRQGWGLWLFGWSIKVHLWLYNKTIGQEVNINLCSLFIGANPEVGAYLLIIVKSDGGSGFGGVHQSGSYWLNKNNSQPLASWMMAGLDCVINIHKRRWTAFIRQSILCFYYFGNPHTEGTHKDIKPLNERLLLVSEQTPRNNKTTNWH